MAPTTVDAPVGRRERKKLETRRALREAALRLFAEDGFDATTIEAITDAADVAPRTFFLHFASKEDVLLGDVVVRACELEEILAAIPDDVPPFEAVRGGIAALLSRAPADQTELRLVARLLDEAPSLMARNLEQYSTVEATVALDVARRTGRDPRTDPFPTLLSACAMATVRVALGAWYARDGAVPVEDLVGEAFDHLAAGFAAAPGTVPTPG